MHEMSIAENILQLIEEAAAREHFSRVRCIRLEIGQLAAVEPEALRFCFDAVTRHGVAQGATLEILPLPGSGWCTQCRINVSMTESLGACPQCGGYQLQVTGGMEMRIKDLEVE